MQDDIFGTVEFIRSARVRRLSVRISAEGIKAMLAPYVPKSEALRFIELNKDLILAKQKKIIAKQTESRIQLSENSELGTLTFSVKIVQAEREKIFFRLKDGILTVEIPLETDCSLKETQTVFWNAIKYFIRKEAKRILPEKVKTLAEKYGFQYKSVKIQSSRGRWGSCSTQKNINLSFYLLLLPEHLIDYVILHELCHTRQMNHSVQFWAQMDAVTDSKSKALRRELKNFKLPDIPE